MKFLRPIHLLLVAALPLLASCESDELAQNGLQHKLEVSPTSLEAEMYAKYTFKARITNMSVHDPIFYWDFDEGRGSNILGWSVDTSFYEPKVHTVRVKAVDPFTEEVLGYDSIRVNVVPPTTVVDISPNVLDTFMQISTDGKSTGAVVLKLKTSTPLHLVRAQWDFGDGVAFEDTGAFANVGHLFSVGTHTVKVRVFHKNGLFLGEDSAVVTVRFPPLSLFDFSSSRVMSVVFGVDSLHSIYQNPLYRNPLAVQFSTLDSSVKDLSSGLTYFRRYDKQDSLMQPFSTFRATWHDTVQATFSEDFQTIRSMRASVSDSGYNTMPFANTWGTLRYTFELKDLELISVTSTTITYRSRTSNLDDFLVSVNFTPVGHKNYPSGTFFPTFTIISFAGMKPYPMALVVFVR